MAALKQIRIAWTGLPTGPGVSTFYSDNANPPPLAALRTFFAAIATSLPGAITLTFPSTGNVLDIDTGGMLGVWSATPPSTVAGSGGSTFAAPAGACMFWKSGVWLGGRQVIGKTFLSPLAPVCFAGDGRIASATQTAFNSAANTLISSAADLRLYSRMHKASTSITAGVTGANVAVLRSRRA